MMRVEASGAFAGQHILITGATGGVGSIIASRLAKENCRISAVGRRADRLDDLSEWIEDLGGDCCVIHEDLREPESTRKIIDSAVERFGPIDTAFLGATHFAISPFDNMKSCEIEDIVRVNLLSPINIVREILPSMIQRGFGRISIIASVAGILPLPFMAVYDATKAGMIAFSRALANELAESGITVTCISPRAVDTVIMNRIKALTETLGWVIDSPESVAEDILRATALGKTHVTLGSMEKIIPIVGSLFPDFIRKVLEITRIEMENFFEREKNEKL
jgi:short-subunit dehydrogenase